MSLLARSVSAVSAGALILALIVPATASAATYVDCSGRTLEAGANFQRCDLSGTAIIGLDLHGINLSRANLQDVNGGCDPDLPRTNLFQARLSHADASRALLCDAILGGADLRGANFTGTSLEDADLRDANASSITLDSATAAFAVFQGTRFTDASMRFFYASSASFDGADLRRADARDAYFGDADMPGADFRGARLDGADFTRADLTGADLHRATGLSAAIWSDTTCPDGSNSDTNGGTCVGHLG